MTNRHPAVHRGASAVRTCIVVAVALIAVLVSATPASAAPVTSTITLQISGGSSNTFVLRAIITSSIAPTGIVEFRDGGVLLGQATVAGNTATFVTQIDATGDRTYTVSYLGSPEVAPSTYSSTGYYQLIVFNNPLTGSISFGSNVAVVGPNNYAAYTNPIYDGVTGAYDSRGSSSAFVDLFISSDVPGHGTVTLAVRPRWWYIVGSVHPDGSASLVASSVTFAIERIVMDGITWGMAADCVLSAPSMTLTGSSGPSGLAFTGTFPAGPTLAPAACDGNGDMVNAILGGPIVVDLLAAGTFTPPTFDVATTTTVTVTPDPVTSGDLVTLQATTTAGGAELSGWVEFRDNGVMIGSASSVKGVTYTTTLTAFMDAPGLHTITAEYLGQTWDGQTVRLPSTGTVEIDVAGPTGRPASGSWTLVGNPTVPLVDGGAFSGGAFDAATGDIGPGTFWFPAGQFTRYIAIFDVDIRYRLTQLTPTNGQVAPDGTVTFSPASFRMEGLNYRTPNSSWSSLGDCAFEPITMTLTGTVDSTGLHVQAPATAIPPTTGNCDGYASYANPIFTGGGDFEFDVAGDFSRDDATPVQLNSWFPTVDQFNQTYLSAAVTPTSGPAPTGDITFRDGDTILGIVPVDADGKANLAVALDLAGTRTITADYHGNQNPGWAATTVEVTPAPVGYAMDGSVTVGNTSLPIAPGSQLLPATPPGPGGDGSGDAYSAVAGALAQSTASLWFMPTTITTDVAGYGPVTAEVRLNQYGALSPATIGAGGSIDGLSGTFVLQIRKITTTAGTETPLGCVNLVMLAFDGQLTYTDVDLASADAGIGRIPWTTCTGAAQALADQLTGTSTTAIHATL